MNIRQFLFNIRKTEYNCHPDLCYSLFVIYPDKSRFVELIISYIYNKINNYFHINTQPASVFPVRAFFIFCSFFASNLTHFHF